MLCQRQLPLHSRSACNVLRGLHYQLRQTQGKLVWVVAGEVYDVATDTWRSLPPAPISARSPLASVWTGSRWLLWGAGPGRESDCPMDGASYDPATNTWSAIPEAPLRINDGHAVWTGTEMIVFGAELLGGNHSQTKVAVGEAYDPAAGTWRTLSPSHIDPQATDVVWDGREMVAADYLVNAAAYDPVSDTWSSLPKPPIDPGEDRPDLAVARGRVVEHFFGRTILLLADHSGWEDVGGPGDHGSPLLVDARRFVAGFSQTGSSQVWAYVPPRK